MGYLRYMDSNKLRDAIRNKHIVGRTTKEIAEETGRPQTTISYHLKALGIQQERHRKDVVRCLVCGKNPVERSLGLVCRDPLCHGQRLYIETFMVCQLRQEDADMYILDAVQPRTTVNIPINTAVVCVKDLVHRVYIDNVDHLKYHIYCWKRSVGESCFRPPSPLWIHKSEDKIRKDRVKEADYIRRNTNSEHPQPRRIRW